MAVALISFLIMAESCGTVKSNSSKVQSSTLNSLSLFNGKDLTGWYTFIRGKPARGKIQIQSEWAEMFVRKVEITPLTSDK